MRIPIKLNKNNFPKWVGKILPVKSDPSGLLSSSDSKNDFEEMMTSIKIDNTWKSTLRNRHKQTNELIKQISNDIDNTKILEIGISNGVTSVELIQELGHCFEKYYATDLYFSVSSIKTKNELIIYHPLNNEIIIIINKYLLIYNDLKDSNIIFKIFIKQILKKAQKYDKNKIINISFIHPELENIRKEDNRIKIIEYNMFDRWENEKVHIIKIANVLNRTYFKDDEIKKVVYNIKNILYAGGYLIVIDNRKHESSTIYKINTTGEFSAIQSINGGCDIDDLICQKN